MKEKPFVQNLIFIHYCFTIYTKYTIGSYTIELYILQQCHLTSTMPCCSARLVDWFMKKVLSICDTISVRSLGGCFPNITAFVIGRGVIGLVGVGGRGGGSHELKVLVHHFCWIGLLAICPLTPWTFFPLFFVLFYRKINTKN